MTPVKFDEFWNVLASELSMPRQFATQTKQFSAKYSGGRIVVTTSDDYLWSIERSTMRDIWNKALDLHEKMRFIHTNYSHDNIRTSSYILALMKHYTDETEME